MMKTNNTPRGWLAFELNVLKRLKFTSIALPFTADPQLGAYLKRWQVRVLANDITQSGWTRAVAAIQNNSEKLSDEEIGVVLHDAYVPGYKLDNPSLRNWFNETDSWWFDNVRRNIESLASPTARAIALSTVMQVGNYVLSFTEETRELRQPLSNVFRRLITTIMPPFANGQQNVASNRPAYDFIAETTSADLMFLRLPAAHNMSQRNYLGRLAWCEEYVRGGDDFWNDLELRQAGRLGTLIETKSQYLRLVEETLRTSAHIRSWAIAHVEDGYISAQDIVETITRIERRRVETIFSKDFSELTGAKAVIITA